MKIMKTKARQENRFLRMIITIPVRALAKARDLYVKSITRYAEKINYGNVSGLPRSFSVNSAGSHHEEYLRELVRVDLDMHIKAEMMKKIGGMPPRSSSVAMGRIDEDKPCCSFGEEIINNGDDFIKLKYPRSRSHAVARSTAL